MDKHFIYFCDAETGDIMGVYRNCEMSKFNI